jgi:mono/diheme cytochrome c family protein
MFTTSIRLGVFSVFYRLAPMMGLVAGLGLAGSAIGPVRAQVNIDQGKSAAEIFAGDCATCHKSARGLADGRNSLTLTAFLREHYTSSGQQAAMLAAYVLGAGAGRQSQAGRGAQQECRRGA